eukprot:scaffold275940_cov33-Tisochrysis_lutea.AAC.6
MCRAGCAGCAPPNYRGIRSLPSAFSTSQVGLGDEQADESRRLSDSRRPSHHRLDDPLPMPVALSLALSVLHACRGSCHGVGKPPSEPLMRQAALVRHVAMCPCATT